MYESNAPGTNFRTVVLLSLAVIIGIGLLLISWILFAYAPTLNEAPTQFPIGVDLVIKEGSTQNEIATYLELSNIIRSSTYFYWVLRMDHQSEFIQAGTYRFTTSMTTKEVIEAIINGTNLSPLVTVTFPEGFSSKNIGEILKRPLSVEELSKAKSLEGYLFPDTYFVTHDATFSEIIALMQETYVEKLAPYAERIANSGFTEKDVIILASLIEREANDADSMKMVSAILQNRLRINMPLQVDAVFDYLFDKSSAELTSEDLSTDSPYNTYTHTGLPPTPIANPGIASIEAVLSPAESKNLYYLTGDDGVFYYAKTFEQHKENKQRYLR